MELSSAPKHNIDTVCWWLCAFKCYVPHNKTALLLSRTSVNQKILIKNCQALVGHGRLCQAHGNSGCSKASNHDCGLLKQLWLVLTFVLWWLTDFQMQTNVLKERTRLMRTEEMINRERERDGECGRSFPVDSRKRHPLHLSTFADHMDILRHTQTVTNIST